MDVLFWGWHRVFIGVIYYCDYLCCLKMDKMVKSTHSDMLDKIQMLSNVVKWSYSIERPAYTEQRPLCFKLTQWMKCSRWFFWCCICNCIWSCRKSSLTLIPQHWEATTCLSVKWLLISYLYISKNTTFSSLIKYRAWSKSRKLQLTWLKQEISAAFLDRLLRNNLNT